MSRPFHPTPPTRPPAPPLPPPPLLEHVNYSVLRARIAAEKMRMLDVRPGALLQLEPAPVLRAIGDCAGCGANDYAQDGRCRYCGRPGVV